MADFLGRVVRRRLYQSRVKWLLTSRLLDSAEQKLLTGPDQIGLNLELNSEHVARGVQAYIAAKVLELDRGKHYGEALRLRLNAELTLKAEATFLWVSLACKALEGIPAESALARVNDSPEGLVPFYQQAFQKLSESREPEACKHILKVLMLAYRPLRVSELGGLANNTNGEEAVRRLIDQCSSFVWSRKNGVEFVHQSARDYLGGKDDQSLLDSSTPYGNSELAMGCLADLNARLKVNLLDLPRPDSTWKLSHISADSNAQQLLQSLEYAATFWMQHLENARYSQAHQGAFAECRVLSEFLHSRFLEWLECLALLGRLRVSVEGIEVLKTISGRFERNNDVSKFAQEAMRFVLRHYSTMAQWPLQIYSSAMLFTPQISMIRRENLGKVPSWLEELPEVEEVWSPLMKTLKGHSSSVIAVAFSHDGTQLASASLDQTIKLWDPSPSTPLGGFRRFIVRSTVGPLRTIPFTPYARSLSYSANASYLKTDRGTIELVSTATNRRDDATRTKLLLSAKDQWIYVNQSPVVRLPQEYILTCFDSYEDVIVVGCSNGSLLRFKIDRLGLCSEMGPANV